MRPESHIPRPTLHEFLHDATHEFLHFDGKILRSVKLLFGRPEFLTRERPEEFGRIRVSGDCSRYGLTPDEVAERVQHAQHDWVPRVMFVLVPIAALVVMAGTRGARRTYVEHLYFALHVHAVCFAVLALAVLLGEPVPPTVNAIVTAIALLFIVGYVIAAIRTTYGGRWVLSIGRATAALVVYGAILAGTVIAIFIGAIVT